jgi:protein kinase C substrate 80K-H
VEPGNEATYGGSTFRCLDGGEENLPAAAINDESCDCADGSDEPGTGACAGQDQTLFFCHNKGSIPRRLYASRVGDGVCDCCDGSDEASLAARDPASKCADKCAEEGREQTVKREEKVAMLRRALKRQDEIRQEGLATKSQLTADLENLKKELSPLESNVAELKVAADAERKEEEAKKAAEAAAKAAEDAAATAAESSAYPNCQWRQTSGCAPDGEKESANDKPCSEGIPKGNSGFCDCDGDGVFSTEKGDKGFTCELEGDTKEMRECYKVCAAEEIEKITKEAATEEEPAAAATDSEEEKPVISEYTKWMEGAEDKTKSEDEKAADAPASEETATDAADTADTPDDAEVAKEPATAREKESEAQSRVAEHKEKIQGVEDSIDNLEAEHLGYATLHNKKISKQVSEFRYDIEFFSKASQDSVSLGSWHEWTGPHSAEFTEGTMCWGGPARKLVVKFVCGEQEEILDVFEPSRCVYQATVEHPGACEQAELEMLSQGKQVVGPKDEL